VTHDINLAARFCTHVLLLDDGKCVAAGAPAEVMKPALLESVYHVQLAAIKADDRAGRWVVPVKPTPDLPGETRHGTGRDSAGGGG
jgi:iron complex transport system ATP-binding protein